MSGEQLPAVDTWFKLREIILLICTMATALSFIGGVHIGARALLDPKLIWFGLYHSPIPVGRRGVIYLFKLFLPDATGLEEGGRGSAPCEYNNTNFVFFNIFF